MRIKLVGLLAVLLLGRANAARAQTFVWSGSAIAGGNGHFYALVTPGPELTCGQYKSYAAARAFAKSLLYNGWPGHIVTLNTEAEYIDPPVLDLLRLGGWTGAYGVGRDFVLDDGPEVGQQVHFFSRPFSNLSQSGTCQGLPNFPRLATNGDLWRNRPDIGIYCGDFPCTLVPGEFAVEFEPDVTPPAINAVNFPGQAARLEVGSTFQFGWDTSDFWSGVERVRLLLSRTGSDGPFDPLATGLNSVGSFSWVVSGPVTPDGSAVLGLEVRDFAGNQTIQKSAPFTIALTAPVPSRRVSWGRIKSSYR